MSELIPYRSTRSLNAEAAELIRLEQEQAKQDRMNAYDALLDLALAGTITFDEVREEAAEIEAHE